MSGKIAFEEHFNLPQFEVPRYYGDAQALREVERRLLDVSEQRLADMDATGIDYAILSLNSPGIQAEVDAGPAVNEAKQVNDTLAEIVAAHPPALRRFRLAASAGPRRGCRRAGAMHQRARFSWGDGQRLHQPRRCRDRLVL
jgi:2,3-dihydroxybenzoate decarboxylase